jgi:hypothetical protein
MALACGLTSVRGNRGENYENEPWFAKNIQRKKKEEKHCFWHLSQPEQTSYDKIPAAYNLWLVCCRSTKFPKLFS